MIKIYTLFKVRDRNLREKINEYLKRIKIYEKIELIENIKNIPENALLLDESGKLMNSKEFAELLKNDLILVVGPPIGFDEKIKKKYKKVSLSRMTLQHELALLVLMEQIYRGETINNNHPYHKEVKK